MQAKVSVVNKFEPGTAISHLPCTLQSSRQVLDFMHLIPHGTLRMSAEVAGEVDSSICLSFASLVSVPQSSATNIDSKENGSSADGMMVHLFARSSADEHMLQSERRLDSLARLTGCATKERFNYFPGWKPDTRSPALQQILKAHQTLFKYAPKVYSVHAGLECGLIQGRYPKIDCVSIGPQIDHAHSPDEQLQISSVAPFYHWLKQSIENLSTVAIHST